MNKHKKELRKKLLAAYREDNFLRATYDISLAENENQKELFEVLVALHNDGEVDLVLQFNLLRNENDPAPDFFITRRLFEKVLPQLNAEVQSVLECILHLVNEAGQDMAANMTFNSLIDFCVAEPFRIEKVFELILESPNKWANFVSPIIVAGTRVDMERFFQEAVQLIAHKNIDIRKRAIFSIGRIQFDKKDELKPMALDILEERVALESDDHLLANIINSTCRVCNEDTSLGAKGSEILKSALKKDGEDSGFALAEAFGLSVNTLPEPIVNTMMDYLVSPVQLSKQSIDLVDLGISRLLQQEDKERGIKFLEEFLLAHSHYVSLDHLDSVISCMLKNQKLLLNKLMTRWFLVGNRTLCDGIRIILNKVHGEEVLLEVEPEEVSNPTHDHLIFLARKVIGFLLFKPTTATNILISLMRMTNESSTIAALNSLLFDPLLLNYPYRVEVLLKSKLPNESETVKEALQETLDASERYFTNLKSVGTIPEMQPSQAQREAYARHWGKLLSDSFKEAMKGSIVNQLFAQSTILHGKKSIEYVRQASGESQRMEIPLNSHGTEIDVPRLESIDPVGLDYMLRVFRAEQMVKP